jgi:hypothetical protein
MDWTAHTDAFDLRHAATDRVTGVTVPARRLFAIRGFGPPRSSDFAVAGTTLLGADARLRETLRRRGIPATTRPAREVLWTPGPQVVAGELARAFTARDGWRWEQVVAIPGVAATDEIEAAVESVRHATGGDQPVPHVVVVAEGPAMQLLQLGGPASETETLDRLLAAAADEGLTLHGPVHQIYLSAVDTIGTDRQRSIVRVPVAPPQAA